MMQFMGYTQPYDEWNMSDIDIYEDWILEHPRQEELDMMPIT